MKLLGYDQASALSAKDAKDAKDAMLLPAE